jgi:hypothetical protein
MASGCTINRRRKQNSEAAWTWPAIVMVSSKWGISEKYGIQKPAPKIGRRTSKK